MMRTRRAALIGWTAAAAVWMMTGTVPGARAQAKGPPANASRAQRADRTNDPEAQALFDAAVLAYNDGRLEDALDLFKRSYELSKRPGLLYNIAMAADRLRHDEEAIAAYQSYLDKVPDSEKRAFVQSRLKALRALHAHKPEGHARAGAPKKVPTPAEAAARQSSANKPPPAAVAPVQAAPAKKEPLAHKWWFWTSIGGGVVVAAVVASVVVATSGGGGSPSYPPGNVGGTVFALGAAR